MFNTAQHEQEEELGGLQKLASKALCHPAGRHTATLPPVTRQHVSLSTPGQDRSCSLALRPNQEVEGLT